MLICQSCGKTIVRPHVAEIADVSHGLCLRCFVVQFNDVEQQSLEQLASDSIEHLPMGAILLDEELRVVGYNAHETRIAGLARDKVMGKRFFVDIAPCMAAASVGQWCATHLHDETIASKEVDWALTLSEGVRLASLSLLSGRGRVAITITLTPLERVA